MNSYRSRFHHVRPIVVQANAVAGPVGRRTPCQDERWPAITAALARLYDQKRRSVRIVDADCGTGSLLLHAVRHARSLGFTAIEARGIDGVPDLIGRARAAAAHLADTAIGVVFDTTDLMTALTQEREFPADIVIWHGPAAGMDETVTHAVAAAGSVVVAEPVQIRGMAA